MLGWRRRLVNDVTGKVNLRSTLTLPVSKLDKPRIRYRIGGRGALR